MNFLRIFKETALPSTLQAHQIYLIAPPGKTGYFEMYVTDQNGVAKRHFNEDDARRIITEVMASQSQLAVVDNISGRNALTGLKTGSEVYVKDASGDSTVNSGGARYLWDGAAWIKTAETEQMDLQLNWNSIQGKPNVSVAEIESAVAQKHIHTNKTQLDKIGEDQNGNLTYQGKAVKTAWENVGW